MPRCQTCHRRLAFGAVCPSDGGRAPDSPASRDAESPAIEGWTLHHRLGRGGSSTVWSATRLADDRPAAIKIATGTTRSIAQRFAREAEVLSRLPVGTAPGLLDHGTLEDNVAFLAMELLEGTTLASFIEALDGPAEVESTVAIARAVLDNLAAVHSIGLSHYDLKPSNIVLVAPPPAPETRLIDFGLTSIIAEGSESSSVDVVAGTTEYMAPERIAGQSTSRSADVYSFGVVLFELLTLRVPFVGDRALIERGHLAMRPPRPGKLAPVPAHLDRLVLDCLAKSPARRPGIASIARTLDNADSEVPASMPDSSPDERPAVQSSRQPVVLLVADLESSSAVSEIQHRGGIIARQQGARHVCAFIGMLCEEPATSALAAAEALASRGHRVALHIAELRVRTRPDDGGLRLYGLAIERPADWLPAGDYEGVLLSKDLEALVDVPLEPARGVPGFRQLARADLEASSLGPFFGREAICAAARVSLERCLQSRTPALVTLVGDTGLGKSRLAAELAAAALDHDIRLITYGAQSGADHATGLLAALGVAELAPIANRDVARDLGDLLVAAAQVQPTALVIDDAHRLGPVLCDAIELATLDNRDTPLWIAVAVNPRFTLRRRQWGSRANRHLRLDLAPMSEEASMELAAELLKPAEYPPAAILRRLAGWAAGNPFFLVEIIRTLKRQGIVKEREGGSHYVATADLENLPALHAGQWLATRLLDGMPEELAALARLCAVLGSEFTRDELAEIQIVADDLSAASPIDTDVGLGELQKLQVVKRYPDAWAFVREAVVEPIARAVSESDTRELRRAAMEFWRKPAERGDEIAMLRFAGHAAATDNRGEAIAAYLALGERARATHRVVDADQLFSAALDLADEGSIERAWAFAGRGQARYRMQRLGDAIDDLEAAVATAAATGASELEASWLLALAEALDWADRYDQSAECVERAVVLARNLGDPKLAARCTVATGRTRWREEKIAEAIALLDRGVAETAAVGDHEYQVIALLLLPLALVFSDRRDEAAERFDQLISLCEAVGDRLHLCAAYANRMFLWRNQPDRAVDDLRRANQLARELGQAGAERVATHNLAEILYWSGDDGESLALASRSFELQQRFIPTPVADDALLLARIHAARREWSRVTEHLEWIREQVNQKTLAPSDHVVIDMLGLLVDGSSPDGQAWDALISRAQADLAAEEFLEVLYMRARAAAHAGAADAFDAAIASAQDKLVGCAVWQPRFAALEGAD